MFQHGHGRTALLNDLQRRRGQAQVQRLQNLRDFPAASFTRGHDRGAPVKRQLQFLNRLVRQIIFSMKHQDQPLAEMLHER